MERCASGKCFRISEITGVVKITSPILLKVKTKIFRILVRSIIVQVIFPFQSFEVPNPPESAPSMAPEKLFPSKAILHLPVRIEPSRCARGLKVLFPEERSVQTNPPHSFPPLPRHEADRCHSR